MRKKRKNNFQPEKTRVIFLALKLPMWLRDRLIAVQEELVGAGGKKREIIWERPEKLHITLVYLGRISETKVIQMIEILREIAIEIESFELNVGYLDYLFQKHGQGLIWMRVTDGGRLVEWHRRLVKELNRNGFSLSERKLVPHITLGRLKRMRDNDQMRVLEAVTEMDLPDMGSFMPGGVMVMCSRYNRELKTTEYEEVERINFKNSNLEF
jgi:2'-5' RNA ligase